MKKIVIAVCLFVLGSTCTFASPNALKPNGGHIRNMPPYHHMAPIPPRHLAPPPPPRRSGIYFRSLFSISPSYRCNPCYSFPYPYGGSLIQINI